MKSPPLDIDFGPVAHIRSPTAAPTVMMVCEHASNRIPKGLQALGLSEAARRSHIAWDPGAEPLAQAMADRLDAVLVSGGVSRLVYDCNRAPQAASSIPERSEVFSIPGNQSLSEADRAQRIAAVYAPFCAAVQDQLARYRTTLRQLITIHSFTPVYNGQAREVEIGILHGRDRRFAIAMMQSLEPDLPFTVRLNEPYAAAEIVFDHLGRKSGNICCVCATGHSLNGVAGKVVDDSQRRAVKAIKSQDTDLGVDGADGHNVFVSRH